jgi:hypothetical protein
MRATLWIAASGFLLASGSAYASPGLPIAHDDTAPSGVAAVYRDDLAEVSPPRRVDVTVTDQGPQPRDIQVARALPSRLARPVLTQGRGQLHLSCPMEDGVGALDVP